MTMVIDPSTSSGLRAASATDARDVFGRSWAGRRVAVVGLGKSGVAAAELLRRAGCRVRATDARRTPQLEALQASWRAQDIDAVELGAHTESFIEGSDLVVVSPGVAESSGPMLWARRRQIPIMSEIDLAFHFCPSPIVAVTGTNGKSTAVTLIADILRASGRAAVACGNLGTPFSSVVGSLTPEMAAVVEVSSFQLLWCEQFRPRIGVLLNIGTNHLDRHQDAAAYLAAKARLFQRQTAEEWAVLNGRDPRVAAIGERCRARRVWFGENRSNPPALQLAEATRRVLNDNAQAVLQVARLLGVADPLAWQVLRGFRGLEHRLERVATIRGVEVINDSKSTTPDSVLFALSQIRGDVVVILGGRNKGLDFQPLVEPLRESRVKGIVLIGESRGQLRRMLNGAPTVCERETLEEAVTAALAYAHPGTTVVFSPACASFDMFRDFEHRGHAFKRIIRKLAQGSRLEAQGNRSCLQPSAFSLERVL